MHRADWKRKELGGGPWDIGAAILRRGEETAKSAGLREPVGVH